MKKLYKNPSIKFVDLSDDDVISTSSPIDSDTGGGTNLGGETNEIEQVRQRTSIWDE